MLPVPGGEHDFENGINAKSCQQSFSGPPIARIKIILAPFIAPGILQNPWGNVPFLFMDPLWKLSLPLCILSHAFRMTFSYFRHFVVVVVDPA